MEDNHGKKHVEKAMASKAGKESGILPRARSCRGWIGDCLCFVDSLDRIARGKRVSSLEVDPS
jgi:hypothetical protein